jgi:hypothetical protein
MTLRNAFANLLTESVTGAVETALNKMNDRQDRQEVMEQPRDLQYARDVNDRMRVWVDNFIATQVVAFNVGSSISSLNGAALSPAWGGTNSTYMVDERWQQSEASMQTFNQVRTNRWVFS